MTYQDITQYSSPNFTTAADVPAVFGVGARKIEGITIHHWGDRGQRFQDVVNYLCTPWQNRSDQRQSSAHYVGEAGRVACIIDPDDAAWHSSNAVGNAKTVGIECRPEATDADYMTIAELIRDLRAVYGDVPLYHHYDWSGTACPGVWDLDRLDRLARTANFGGPALTPAPAPKPAPATGYKGPTASGTTITHGKNEIHWEVEKGDTLGKICQHYYGESSSATLNKVAAYNGIKNVNALTVGQMVWIPGPLVWTIEAPDTVQSIAAYYGVSWEWLKAKNPTQVYGPDTEIYIGNVLRII